MESNTYQYLKIDLEGLWEINSIDIKDMNNKWWNSNTFRYIMTTLSLKKQQNNASVLHLNAFSCLIFLLIQFESVHFYVIIVGRPQNHFPTMNGNVRSKWYYTILKLLSRQFHENRYFSSLVLSII